MISAKADPEAQKVFLDGEMKPSLAETQNGKWTGYFIDASHFVLVPFLGFLRCAAWVFIYSPVGRQRFNVLGVLNVIIRELVIVTNDIFITAKRVCELLHKLADLKLDIPITLFLGIARYKKCALVQTKDGNLSFKLSYLPTYSPNLNIIQRLWKFVKKQCLFSKYYSDIPSFKSAIVDCLSQSHSTHKSTLDTLLTLNFQVFHNALLMPV